MHQGIKNIILTLNHKPTAPQYQALFGFSYSSELKLRELSHIWSTRYSTRCPPVVPNPVLSALHLTYRVGITTKMTKNLVLNFSSKVTPWCDIYWVTSQSDLLFFRSMEEHTKKLLKWLWLGKKTASGKFCMCQHTWERATFSDEPISASIQWWSTFSNDTLKSIPIRASSMYHSYK